MFKTKLDFRYIPKSRIISSLLLLPAVAVGAANAVSPPPALAPAAPALPLTTQDLSVFTVNATDNIPSAVSLSASFPSQNWLRGWSKAGFAPDFRRRQDAPAAAHAAGALFGGGVTCSDLYRYENGLTDAQFMDFATRDPAGKLVKTPGGFYHGAIANRAYLDYVLSWATRQIDAGADTLLLDGPNGKYSSDEGFDLYSMAAFSQYLLDRFVTANGWSVTDDRWKAQFGVDLGDNQQCPGHTIESFNYAGYLQQHGWASEPSIPANPLLPIWGNPEDMEEDTFCAARSRTAWRYWTTQIRLYAQQHHRLVSLAADGINRWVDYQVVPCPWRLPLGRSGEFVPTRSILPYWRVIRTLSAALVPDRDVPIVALQDWTEDGMPWQNLSSSERKAWLQAYAPEVFASGLFFAYPLFGPDGCNASTDGTLPLMEQQARFVRSIAPLLHGVTLQNLNVAGYTGKAEIVVQGQPQQRRLILHLINRLYKGLQQVPQRDRVLQVPVGIRPLAVRLYTAENLETLVPAWSFTPSASSGRGPASGTVIIPIPALTTWDVIRIDLPEWRPLPG